METLEQHLNTLEGKKPGNKYALVYIINKMKNVRIVLYKNENYHSATYTTIVLGYALL